MWKMGNRKKDRIGKGGKKNLSEKGENFVDETGVCPQMTQAVVFFFPGSFCPTLGFYLPPYLIVLAR